MSEIKHTEAQMHAVRDALAETLGDACDCTRVWSAWGVGTMSQDDFVLVAGDDDRLHELTIAALDASGVAELLKALTELTKCPTESAGNGWRQIMVDATTYRAALDAIAMATGSRS